MLSHIVRQGNHSINENLRATAVIQVGQALGCWVSWRSCTRLGEFGHVARREAAWLAKLFLLLLQLLEQWTLLFLQVPGNFIKAPPATVTGDYAVGDRSDSCTAALICFSFRLESKMNSTCFPAPSIGNTEACSTQNWLLHAGRNSPPEAPLKGTRHFHKSIQKNMPNPPQAKTCPNRDQSREPNPEQ